MRVLFLFLDGVGLGLDDPQTNPLSAAQTPVLARLLGGKKLLASASPFHGEQASLLSLDARMGVTGIPQSATGQASLLTGRNVPLLTGGHYGPKPNTPIAAQVQNGNLFNKVHQLGLKAGFLNAYPPSYFQAIESGLRIYSAIPLAAHAAGIPLLEMDDLLSNRAISADFTGLGWRQRLGFPDFPLLEPPEAGRRLAQLAGHYDFSLFEYWLSDYAGHQQKMEACLQLIEQFDRVVEGLASKWDHEQGLILITSDHGNLEDMSTRRHTLNPVPALLIGNEPARLSAIGRLKNLADVTPFILDVLQSA